MENDLMLLEWALMFDPKRSLTVRDLRKHRSFLSNKKNKLKDISPQCIKMLNGLILLLPILTTDKSAISINNYKLFLEKIANIFNISRQIINCFFNLFVIKQPSEIAGALI